MNANHEFPRFIVGEFIVLRKVTVDDAKFIYDLRTSKVAEFLNQPPDYSVESQRKWIESRNDSEVNYIIQNRLDERVGMVGIVDVNWNDRVSSVGRLLLKEWCINQSTPYGVEALLLTYGYVFDIMNFRKISGVILGRNEKVFGLQKYLGMTQEGYMKDHVLLRGKPEDLYVMSLMKEDFPQYAEKIDKIISKFR